METEWGVMFPPPHVNAFEVVWMPCIEDAARLYLSGGCSLVRRQCLPYEIVAPLK